MRRRDGVRLAGRVLDPEPVDQERDRRRARALRKKAFGPIASNSFGRDDEARRRARRGSPPRSAPRPLPRRASLPAVASAMKPEDRRDAGGGRGALQRCACRRGQAAGPASPVRPVRTTAIAAEDRAVQHHPVMTEPVGQDPEDRREDELGQVERGGEQADHACIDPGPPCAGSVRQVQRRASRRSGPVLKRSVKVPRRTNRSERSMAAMVAASGAVSARSARRRPDRSAARTRPVSCPDRRAPIAEEEPP